MHWEKCNVIVKGLLSVWLKIFKLIYAVNKNCAMTKLLLNKIWFMWCCEYNFLYCFPQYSRVIFRVLFACSTQVSLTCKCSLNGKITHPWTVGPHTSSIHISKYTVTFMYFRCITRESLFYRFWCTQFPQPATFPRIPFGSPREQAWF